MKCFNKVAAACCIVSVTACSSVSAPSLEGVSGYFGRSDAIEVSTKYTPSPNAPQTKYAATVRMGKFVDERKTGDARQIGIGGRKVSGLSREELVISQDVASYVAAIMRNRLDDSGFQVLDEQAPGAVFEISALIKELTLNVKARDEVNVVVEYSLKEVATGKLVWSGLVVEKSSRFAGVSGNNRADVAAYLKQSLWVTSGKAVTAFSDALMASRPQLFNMTPGVKPISGVTVYVSPAGASSAAPAPNYASPQGAPVLAAPAAVVAPASAYTPRASATSGLLLVNTNPARAKVYVDGVYFGLSPLRVEVDPGVHAVSVKLEGYKMATEKVSVRRGDNTEMDLVLER
jgi:hypothetical protein